MKKFFSLLLFSSLCLLTFTSISVTKFVHAEEDSTAYERTVFVVQGEEVANTTNGVFIYDSSDNCLKLLNNNASLSTSFDVGDCLDLCSVQDKIYMLTTTNIVVFDTSTMQTNTITVNGLQSYHTKISVALINNSAVLCVYPLDTADGQTVLYGTDSGSGYQFYTIEFSQNEFNQTTNISLLDFITYNNEIYLLKAYGKSLTSFPVTSLGNSLVLSTATTLVLQDGNEDDEIVALKNLYTQDSSNIVISYQNKTDIYDFAGESITFKTSVTHRYQEDLFNCVDMSVNGSSVALLGNNCYYIAQLEDNFEIVSKMGNAVCNITYRTADKFDYYTLSAPSTLILTLGTNQTVSLPQDSHVVEIADVKLSDDSALLGYRYVMYTQFENTNNQVVGTNLFGYVISYNNCLVKNEQISTNYTVKVFENTKLYSLPSIITDTQTNQNILIKNISANVPVKILCYITDFSHTYNQTITSYALVSVNGDLGFINTKAIVSTDMRVILAIPNAELISSANVYENTSTSSSILHNLQSGKRVKIIERRDSNGFLKIAYNDTDGNYFEGYIKAHNVKSDGYTTLQIIGTVLVLLNVVFLIILLITKRKITR